jgi:hypothetical protein
MKERIIHSFIFEYIYIFLKKQPVGKMYHNLLIAEEDSEFEISYLIE